jgi:hypothetical protein
MTLRVGAAGRERFLIEREGDVLHCTKYVYARYVSMSAIGDGVRGHVVLETVVVG